MAITDPNDYTNTKLWVDPLQGITASAGKISDWADQSGEGNDLAQGTAGEQPSDAREINGRAVVDFDGVDDWMSTSAYSSPLSQPVTIAFLAKLDANTGGNIYIFDSLTANRLLFNSKSGTPQKWNINGGAQFFNEDSDEDLHWHHIEFDGTSSKHFVDGVLNDSGNGGTKSMGNLAIASKDGGGVGEMDGLFGDIVIIDTAILSAGDRSDLEDWGMQKWGLVVTLAPANPACVAGDEKNTLSWDITHGSTSYDLYWSTSTPVTTGDTKISGITSSYDHTGLTNGTQYYYAIVSQNDAGESALSAERTGTPAGSGSPPSAPTSPLCVIGNAQNTVSWVAPADTDSYKLYWKLSSPVTTGDNEIILGDVLSYLHTGRTNGTDYFYAVLAANEHGDGDLSTEVSGVPIAPPANLAAVPGSASQENDISWDASAGALSYNLYFKTSPGVTTGDTELTGVTSPYTHTGITNDQIYYYRVEAVNADGDSALSNEDDATPYGVPVAPTGVFVASGDEYNAISFNSVAHADSYNIYWDTTPTITTGDTEITGVTSPYNHTSLVNGTTYYYAIEAENTRGVSPLSAEVNGTPAVPAPPSMDNKSNLNILAAVILQTRGRV